MNALVQVAELLPNEPFTIENFVDNGTMPTNAVTFIDPYGERRYFAFQQDNSFGLDPVPQFPEFLENVENGRIRVFATTGNGSRWDLGYFAVDVNNFDPDTWLVANSYRWAAYVMAIWELHNIQQVLLYSYD